MEQVPLDRRSGPLMATSMGPLQSAAFSTACHQRAVGQCTRRRRPASLHPLFQFDVTHGASPMGPLIEGAEGNLYGTTYPPGTVFKITPAGKLTVIHSFVPEQMVAC